MKKLVLVAGLLVAFLPPALAQTVPPQPDQYCILETASRSGNRSLVSLITGADPAQTQQTEEVARMKTFEYEVDALNYLSSRGWEVISVGQRNQGGGVRYYLRRHRP
ncbi:hypothetical protein GO988_06940 [Hymenobacter sp. HMF4947]|uniref:DUF4177 domain-containing protein n=1 Tax=Hymenobacter ginkgonis TaxID=2682976 RepID=A0A7K1TCB9_9BACT|nr:hypothetical protein [Hymenobacter ginkgonis]MVN76056.1 hypothetical protein [Hymenobacter ginkgonis]